MWWTEMNGSYQIGYRERLQFKRVVLSRIEWSTLFCLQLIVGENILDLLVWFNILHFLRYSVENKRLRKNLLWYSLKSLLPYIKVEEYFINSFAFIFNRYFLCLTVDKLRAFIGIVNNFRILLECGCIHLIRTTKWFILYPR